MFWDLLTAVSGIVIVMGSWYAIQAWVRRESGCRGDHDVLGYMAHGCGACDRSKCRKGSEKEHHEVV